MTTYDIPRLTGNHTGGKREQIATQWTLLTAEIDKQRRCLGSRCGGQSYTNITIRGAVDVQWAAEV